MLVSRSHLGFILLARPQVLAGKPAILPEAQVDHLSSEDPFTLGLKSRPLVTQGVLGSSCTFLARDLESAIFTRSPIFFR